MARKNRNGLPVGHGDFIPRTDAERIAHAEVLSRAHAEHGCATHADHLREAGEYYAMAGEYERAEQAFLDAIEVPEARPGLGEASYASYLFERQRDEEALAQIALARRARPRDAEVFLTIGETLEERELLPQAARWFTAGLVELAGALTDVQVGALDDDPDIAMLAAGRYRVRQAAGMPADHIDGLVEEFLQANMAKLGVR